MVISNTNLSMIRGDTEHITLNVKDEDGVQIPFEFGDTVYFTVRSNLGDEELVLQKTITGFTDGLAVVEILPEDTSDMFFRTYVYDIQWNKSNGEVKTIVAPSDFTILGEVTYD